jgi:molecular chaperone GrpE
MRNLPAKPDKKGAEGEKEEICTKDVAELEASLKEKIKIEETYLNQLKYARADLENLQKHMQKRIDQGVTMVKEKLILQLVPIAEELDLALEEARRDRNGGLLEGTEMVREKLWKVLNCEGLCPIEAIGKPFDPHLHEAVQEVETCDQPEGTVIEEVRKGYLLNDKVLRPSMVKVACNPRPIKIQKVNEK